MAPEVLPWYTRVFPSRASYTTAGDVKLFPPRLACHRSVRPGALVEESVGSGDTPPWKASWWNIGQSSVPEASAGAGAVRARAGVAGVRSDARASVAATMVRTKARWCLPVIGRALPEPPWGGFPPVQRRACGC